MLLAFKERFEECGFELHPVKTRIVYCKDGKRKAKCLNKSFDFLRHTFRPWSCKNRIRNSMFVSFTPAVSKTALKAMRAKIRRDDLRNRTDLSLEEIAKWYIQFYKVGLTTMEATVDQDCIRSGGTSIRH